MLKLEDVKEDRIENREPTINVYHLAHFVTANESEIMGDTIVYIPSEPKVLQNLHFISNRDAHLRYHGCHRA